MNRFERRKETVYNFICSEFYTPMRIRDFAVLLQVDKADRAELEHVLDALVKEGKITLSKRGKYAKAEKVMLRGIFRSTSHGFGFVEVEGEEDDIFISGRDTNGAMNKDEVLIEVLPDRKGKRKEAVVREITKRGTTTVVGYFEKNNSFGFVRPDDAKFDRDIFVPVERSLGAVTGHKVVVEITDFGDERRKPEGFVREVLGHANEPGVDILSIARGYEIPDVFSEKIKNQVVRVAKDVSEADMAGRRDLRGLLMVTIDGEDAKDLDDAVSLTFDGSHYHLGVHIADVTNYVQENSALDREALLRGTSVYLADRVIPMLPFELSNGICSLNEGEVRLALSCLMEIDEKGNVVDHEICESVIQTNHRMTYTSVNKILTGADAEESKKYADVCEMLLQMGELSKILRAKRHKRGAIDFDFPEAKIVLDEAGRPIDIHPYERNAATKLIEDFMLAANETVAEDFYWRQSPFVFRTHEKPDAEKILRLEIFIRNFGYGLKTNKEAVHPKEIQKLLDRIEGTPEEALIARLALRSMKQAKYTTDCSGHFGLAAQYYCHFTSPIRRYPDLQIHRIIKEHLRGRMGDERREHYEKILPEVAKQSSTTERRADEAERETLKLKKVQYMEQFYGEQFEGVVSGITGWGMYVELENTVEGLVRLADMQDDFYNYDEANMRLVGERTKKCYNLGQRVCVRMAGADELQRTIDFELVE